MSKKLSDMFKEFENSQEEQKSEKILEKITPELEKIDSLIESEIKPKKLKIGSADIDLLSKSLDKATGFDIPNIHISQDDLWLLYRLKFGKSTRTKRNILLPQFTEAFKRNLAKMKK